MIKAELIEAAAGKTDLTKKDVGAAVDAVLDVITEALQKGEKIQLVGFGSFDVKDRAERTGRNPQTKQEIVIPAARVIQFKPGKALKDAVAE